MVSVNKHLVPPDVTTVSAAVTVRTTLTGVTATIPITVTVSGGSSLPFGQIDTPIQDAAGVQGAIGVTGWALDDVGVTGVKIYRNCLPFEPQQSCQMIGNQQVVFLGDASFLGGARPDVQAAFPDHPVPPGTYCNDDVSNIFGNTTPQAALTMRAANPTRHRNLDAGRAAICVYSVDTSTLSNGLHTIVWSVTDSAGRVEGIGSRFFHVLNNRPAGDGRRQ